MQFLESYDGPFYHKQYRATCSYGYDSGGNGNIYINDNIHQGVLDYINSEEFGYYPRYQHNLIFTYND